MSANRGNTKMCSVLFVDIVGYSKKTNIEQISLKERFVSLWGRATSEVPSGDVMVVDAGDGAAMTSLVEPEDTIRVALRLRELMEKEDKKFDEPMLLRIGINFGPVQLSTDVHGKPCVVGDAINIAQRVMSFADPGQIMVSRSYYDVILPLSHKYEEMFYYLGKRADKHVRYHDVYGLGSANQAAALGRVMEGDLGHDHHADAEEETKEKSTTSTQPTVTVKPKLEEWAPPKRSVGGKFLRGLLSLLGSLFFFVKFGVLLVVIYEAIVLIPIMKEPDHVRLELNNQIGQIKGMWSGLLAAEETLSTATSEKEPAKTAPKSPSKIPAKTPVQQPKSQSTETATDKPVTSVEPTKPAELAKDPAQ